MAPRIAAVGTATTTWEEIEKKPVGFKVSVSEGYDNPLEYHIGRADTNMLYVKCGCAKLWPAHKFLAAMDGRAGVRSWPGWLATVLSTLWLISCLLLLLGLFQWRDCRRLRLDFGDNVTEDAWLLEALLDDDDGGASPNPCHEHAHTFAIISALLALPGYVADISTFQVSVMKMVWCQWECKLIMFQNVLSSVLFSALLRDWRVLIVWCNIFVGITEIAFSDAIPVRTKARLSIADVAT